MSSPTPLPQIEYSPRGEEDMQLTTQDDRPDQLPTTVAPVGRIPYELLAEMLRWIGITYPRSLLDASGVCKYWRDVALHTPRAWSCIILSEKGALDLLKLILERSGRSKLYVYTDVTLWSAKRSDNPYEIANAKLIIIKAHLGRVHHLEIDSLYWLREVEPLLLNQSWPNLDTVVLKGCSVRSMFTDRSMLPSLVHLGLDDWPDFPSVLPVPLCPIRILSFGQAGLCLGPIRSFSITLEELALVISSAQGKEFGHGVVHLPRLVKLTLSARSWPERVRYQQSIAPVVFYTPRLETFINRSGISGFLDDDSLLHITTLTLKSVPDPTRYPSVRHICMLEVQFADLLLFLENLAPNRSWLPCLSLVEARDPVVNEHTPSTISERVDYICAMEDTRLLRHETVADFGWRFWIQPLAT